MVIIGFIISLFLALAAKALREHWKRLLREREFERGTGDARRSENEITRLENRLLIWHLIYLATLDAALVAFLLTLKEIWLHR